MNQSPWVASAFNGEGWVSTELARDSEKDLGSYIDECIAAIQSPSQEFGDGCDADRFLRIEDSSLFLKSDVYGSGSLTSIHNDLTDATPAEIRHQINQLYGLEQPSPSTSPQLFKSPSNIQELIDILVRRFLPKFWTERMQDEDLNVNKNRSSDNTRPHRHVICTTCVECGYKFVKQLIYDGPATERNRERSNRIQRRAEAVSEQLQYYDNEDRDEDGDNHGDTSSDNGKSGSDDEADEMKEKKKVTRPRKRAPAVRREDRPIPLNTSSLGPPSTTFSTDTVKMDLLNLNRSRGDYDGNLDHIGTKKNDHRQKKHKCPLNPFKLDPVKLKKPSLNLSKLNLPKLVSNSKVVVERAKRNFPVIASATATNLKIQPTKKHEATKLHVGWDVVPGHDFSPLINPVTGNRYGPWNDKPKLHVPFTTYYPARSLMASFVHLLPRNIQLTTICIRKLFAYFIWHPWLDTDLQAITLRASYHELWASFMVLGEGLDPDPKAAEAAAKRKLNEANRLKRLRTKDPMSQKRGRGTRTKQPQQQQEEAAEKYKEEKGVYDADEEDSVTGPLGMSSRVKKQRRSTKSHLFVQDQSCARTQFRAKIACQENSENDDVCDHESHMTTEEVEFLRLKSMEERFITNFEDGLRAHHIYVHRRFLTPLEMARRERDILYGWVPGGDLLIDNPEFKSRTSINPRTMGLYVAVDSVPCSWAISPPVLDDNRKNDIVKGHVVFIAKQILSIQEKLVKFSELSGPLLTHNDLTLASVNAWGAMSQMERLVQGWVYRAEAKRQCTGFQMPLHERDSDQKTQQPGFPSQAKSKQKPKAQENAETTKNAQLSSPLHAKSPQKDKARNNREKKGLKAINPQFSAITRPDPKAMDVESPHEVEVDFLRTLDINLDFSSTNGSFAQVPVSSVQDQSWSMDPDWEIDFLRRYENNMEELLSSSAPF
ncbi:hypothetical protein BGZ83_010531 [Gryganskiella cystojenkinii]|nr:hypothetical protein BGZ83_010531 [Gryganskiella cystojenkinii]